ncbi:MAG: DUF4325 domain-containing protein [Zunongwangia sp.]|mgnify:FL=1|uniref:DUF4325 domain-containing protein n=3 Tax=Zunongwangia profunda TaxID=398743 RepID=D5BER1_ZUNPS|nr:hypothetical protein ZPR_0432 [Zunongwangia profunda SM-A87]MAO34676.1 DUF4325 domain-containing protein [Zunongwangia sp.]MAS69780.1 DUF4325 domain-containing protein [Zunongwangia sp.]HCV82321.1 DUF4325 domain-containing protein [Zunongwangia profunda]|tara:strand:- start:5005 stop:5331 length:327 start_codon:yes stop_codon:yes gene_type:complete
MKMELKKILGSSLATNPKQGKSFFSSLNEAAQGSNEIEISFEGIELLSSAFLNESIGKFVMMFPDKESNVKFIYPIDQPIFETKVNDVLDNVKMGDKYDEWLENAQTH